MTPEEAQRFFGEFIGAGIIVWAVSWIIRKVLRVNRNVSYVLSIAFWLVVAILIGAFLTTPESAARYAALYIIAGLFFWMVAATYSWIVNGMPGVEALGRRLGRLLRGKSAG